MTFTMELDPHFDQVLQMKLMKNVKNAEQLQKKLMRGEVKCCAIKPSLICDPFQVVVAANKAVSEESLTTKSIFTEILFNLSISKNITQSLRKFGIDGRDTSLLLVTLDKKGENKSMDEVTKQIIGEEVDMSSLHEMTNVNLIKKTYKINDTECRESSLLDSVISRIATKDFVSF